MEYPFYSCLCHLSAWFIAAETRLKSWNSLVSRWRNEEDLILVCVLFIHSENAIGEILAKNCPLTIKLIYIPCSPTNCEILSLVIVVRWEAGRKQDRMTQKSDGNWSLFCSVHNATSCIYIRGAKLFHYRPHHHCGCHSRAGYYLLSQPDMFSDFLLVPFFKKQNLNFTTFTLITKLRLFVLKLQFFFYISQI